MQIPVFVGSDILEDTESDDGSQHVVERRCKLNIEAPYLLKVRVYIIGHYLLTIS